MLIQNNTKYENVGYGSVVNAIYSNPICGFDKENIFIKALPTPLTDDDDILSVYTKELKDYSCRNVKKESMLERLLHLTELNKLRIPVPYNKILEIDFYSMLVSSYRERTLQKGNYAHGEFRLIGNTGDATVEGISLIGRSGCGKSTAIKMLTDRYPQVITHLIDEKIVRQVVYLCVSCPANSNFTVLYNSIGAALDNALNVDIYERLVTSKRQLGDKQTLIENLIGQFCIGCIILDEIQLLDFNSNKESSYQALLTIVNKTKVGLMIVGTEEAKSKMFSKEQNGRRVGKTIRADDYCRSKPYYTMMLGELWKYQWLDKKVELTDDIVELLYDKSKGVIAHTTAFFKAIQFEYLVLEGKVEINYDFINNVITKYFEKLVNLLNEVETIDNSKEASKLVIEANKQFSEITSKLEEDAIKKEQENIMDSFINKNEKKKAKKPKNKKVSVEDMKKVVYKNNPTLV